MKIKLLILLLLLGTRPGFSTPPDKFWIVRCSGSLQYSLNGNANTWKNVTNDTASFPATAFLKVTKSMELLLLGSNNIYYKFNKPGVYKLSNLNPPEQPSVLSRFFQYIKESFSSDEHPDLEKNRLAYMENPGIVPRGGETPCDLLLPVSGYVAGDTIRFSWKNSALVPQMFVIYSDTEAPPVFKKEISDSAYSLPVKDVTLQAGKKYFWTIADQADYKDCILKDFSWVGKEEAAKVKSERKKLKASLTFSKGINALVLAYFYAEKGWSNDAVSYYNQALLLEPNSPAVKSAKEYFGKLEKGEADEK